MARPICVECGQRYGRRATTRQELRWPLDQERPAYTGNGVVVKENFAYKTANREAARSVMMLSINPNRRKFQEQDLMKLPEKSEWVSSREIWDGESWEGGYKPFCTLRCALLYARKAYRSHHYLRS